MSGNDPLLGARLALALLEHLAGHSPHESGAGRVVLVSSARPREGRSFVAGLLHAALRAQGGAEPALVDGAALNRLLGGEAVPQPALLFQPAAVQRALRSLRGQYALALVDGPPLAGCGALAREADAVLLVVDAHATPQRSIERALADARIEPARLAGVVLNRREAALPRWLGAD